MGVRELQAAFNEVTGPQATCITALLDYERKNDVEWQVLIFSGTNADGTGFVVKSDRVGPGADLAGVARATAALMLQQKRTT